MRKGLLLVLSLFACVIGIYAQTTVVSNGSSKKLGKIDFKELESMYQTAIGEEIDFDIPAPVFYSVFDLDHDGLDEVLIADAKKEYSALFCFGSGKAEVVEISHEFKKMSILANSAVSAGGSCGTGCAYCNYHKVSGSRVSDHLEQLALFNMETEKVDYSYSKSDVDIDEAKGKAIVESFGKAIVVKHHWRKIPQKQ